MYGEHACMGITETIKTIATYFDKVPPANAEQRSQLAHLQNVNKLLNRGHAGLYQCEQPNRQWPANGDNQRPGFDLGTLYGQGSKIRTTLKGNDWLAVTRTPYSGILPAYGHVALRSTEQETDSRFITQMQFDYQHSGMYHHMPRAALMIQLTAFGHTFLDGYRYERTRLRNRNGIFRKK